MAYFYLGLNASLMGDFAQALAFSGQAQAIGDTTGNPRLQSLAAWVTGWIYATQGEWDAGIALCERGLERSPDPLNTAGALGYLGTAYLEQGNVAQAIPLLEQSIQQWQQFHFPQLQGWFTALLGEAYLRRGDLVQGQDLTRQGLTITQEAGFAYGVGVAQRALGQVAQARGALGEAAALLHDALQTFTTMSARFEAGRTHLVLADLAATQEQPAVAAQHLQEACNLFRTLRVPLYVERTRHRAAAFGVSLVEDEPA
jgi:tetratricopeptide (TPR) repeat protein